MRWVSRALLLFLFAYLALVVYTSRALFFSTFDVAYWKDKFEHSQWSLPLSVRTIGDDGLYLYEGYRLVHGGDPTLFNAEVPPLGKYFIGTSITVFGNGYIYGFITTALLAIFFFLTCELLLHKRIISIAATAILITDPLITGQFPLTMLDSLQAFFLMVFLFLLLTTTRKRPWWHPAITGLVLGFFSETKFPILTPFIALIGLAHLWTTYRKLRPLIWYSACIFLGYLIPYIPYFVLGHTPLDWIRAQKWIVSFYIHGKLMPTRGSAIVNLLIGQYQNIFTRTWSAASHWSPSWSVATLGGIAGLFTMLKKSKRDYRWITVGSVFGVLLIFYQIIPFWTRYLVTMLPLLYLCAAALFSRLPQRTALLIMSTMVMVNILSSIPILFPTPEATAHQVIYNWENMFFQDMYEDITLDRRARVSRADYRQFALRTLTDAQIESIRITMPSVSWQRFIPKQSVAVHVTYFTRNLGSFSEDHDVTFIKENGRWRVPWEWDYLVHNLTVKRRLQTEVELARRGTLVASDKKPIAEDVPNNMIWVTPNEIDRTKEDAMLKFIEGLFEGKIAAVYFHQRIHGNSLPAIPVPLGVPPLPLNPKQRTTLASFPGVTLTPSYGRINHGSGVVDVGTVANTQFFECCTLLYTTMNYDGITGAEKLKNAELKGTNGGSLVMIDANGIVVRTILEVEKKDGQDTQP